MDEFTATYSTLLKSELLGVDAVVSDGRFRAHAHIHMRARSHIFARTHALPGSRQARRGEDGRLVAAAEPVPLPGTARRHPPVWVRLGSLDGLRSAPLACASTCHSCGVVRPCAPLCGRTHALRAGLIGCLFVCLRARSLTAAAVCPL